MTPSVGIPHIERRPYRIIYYVSPFLLDFDLPVARLELFDPLGLGFLDLPESALMSSNSSGSSTLSNKRRQSVFGLWRWLFVCQLKCLLMR